MWGVGVGESWQLPDAVPAIEVWVVWVMEKDYEHGGYQGRVLVEGDSEELVLERLPRQIALQLTPEMVDDYEIWKMAPRTDGEAINAEI